MWSSPAARYLLQFRPASPPRPSASLMSDAAVFSGPPRGRRTNGDRQGLALQCPQPRSVHGSFTCPIAILERKLPTRAPEKERESRKSGAVTLPNQAQRELLPPALPSPLAILLRPPRRNPLERLLGIGTRHLRRVSNVRFFRRAPSTFLRPSFPHLCFPYLRMEMIQGGQAAEGQSAALNGGMVFAMSSGDFRYSCADSGK